MFPKQLNRQTIYESPWINLYTDRVLMPSGKIIESYHVLDYPYESVVVLLINQKKEICFIKSLRYITGVVGWELPAGKIEPKETILEAAKREVLEETGYQVQNLKKMYSFQPSSGISNQTIHIIFGDKEKIKQKKFDTDEVEEVHWFSQEKILDLIQKKSITDGVSLNAVLLYLQTHSMK